MSPEGTSAGALYLAIDQGGQGSRALVFDGRARVVAEGFCELGANEPRANWVEQNPDGLVSSVSAALGRAAAALGESCKHIVTAGLATQRSSIACWDKETGAALSPVISWQDRRAYRWLEQFGDQTARIHEITGLFPNAHYGASKLRWCLDNLPAVRSAYGSGRLAWGPVASFLLFRLLDERPLLADPANASRTLLWGIRRGDWDAELLALFGLPAAPLPQCVPSRYEFGALRIGDKKVPVTIVTGDQSAAVFAFGHPRSDTAYVTIGTGAFVQRLSDQHPESSARFLTSVVLQDRGQSFYALEGTVNGAASALRWLEREHRLAAVEAKLAHWLAHSVSPPLFLNGVSGLGSPYWVADFRSRFVGEGDVSAKAVAVVESIVFLLQTNLEGMQAFAATTARIQVGGGLAQLDGLCQRLADISALPVYRPAQCEATARGTAFLLAGRPAAWPQYDIDRRFEPQHNPGLRQRYQAWREAMRAALACDSAAD